MKKLINAPEAFVDEMLDGVLLAYPRSIRPVGGDRRSLVRADSPRNGKVGIVTGGGSGHLPLFLGYVGKGLADGVAVGGAFQSPSAEQVLTVTKAVDGGAGVLYLFGNYQGDIMNFEMAAELAQMEGISTRIVRVSDDVASAPRENWTKRRGIAGLFFAYKVTGARAEEMASLDEVAAVAQKAVENTRSMGVALSPCTIPEVGRPSFNIAEDEMEIGMGIHGEPGISRGKIRSADAVFTEVTGRIVEDLPFQNGDEVAVLVNGLGATPLEELYIVFRTVARELKNRKIDIYRTYIGEYATSLEMAGCSLSLIRLDEELKRLIDAPASSPFFVQEGR